MEENQITTLLQQPASLWRLGQTSPGVSTMQDTVTLDDVRFFNHLLNASDVSNLAHHYSLARLPGTTPWHALAF